MPETTDATAANSRGATVVDATSTDALAVAVDSADDDDDIDAEYQSVDSPKSITHDLPGFGSRMDFMRAQFNQLSAALRVQERLLRHQQDIREQAEALRSTAEALRAAHLRR
jgi:hypothetical protein